MNWSVTKLECLKLLDSLSDVVIRVSWIVNQDTESFDGVTTLGLPGDTFTPFDQLTQDQVLTWVWDKVSKEGTESIITTRLSEKANPSTIDPPLPWT